MKLNYISTCGALLAAVLALSACNTTSRMSGTNTMMTRLSGASEVPAVASPGAGSVETSYNILEVVLQALKASTAASRAPQVEM